MVNEFSVNMLTQEPSQIDLLLIACIKALKEASKPIILFGAGNIGVYYLGLIKKIGLPMEIYFCDNNPAKWETTVENIRVISPKELEDNFRDSYIIITSLNYYWEIFNQLSKYNLRVLLEPSVQSVFVADIAFYEAYNDYFSLIRENEDSFIKAYELLSDEYSQKLFYDRLNFCISANSRYLTPLISKHPQYFEPGIINLTNDEILIDGGAFTGDTVEEFLKQTHGKYKAIYSFEPEEAKRKEFYAKLHGYENIKFISCGLWSSKNVLCFSANNSLDSGISENGDIEIPVASIDEVLNGEPATFIKMDIEGAELEALKGAENTIRKYKPKLAICVYHKPLDIVDIPLYLKDIVPEYKIYLRHYNIGASETVCYAVAD